MLELAKAVVILGAVIGLWLAVHHGWRRVFGVDPEEDVLAGRTSCHGCTCSTPCDPEPWT